MYRNDVKREDLAIPKPPLSLFKFKVSGNPATLGENWYLTDNHDNIKCKKPISNIFDFWSVYDGNRPKI